MNTLGRLRSRLTRKGSALVIVMLTMLVMGFVIAYSIEASKQDTHNAYLQVRTIQARYLAEGAVERAKGDILSQIAATNFLGGSFATVPELYLYINNRFNVDDKRISDSVPSEDIDWKDAATISRSLWDFDSDSTLDIPGVNDWGFGPDGADAEPIGPVRAYITRARLDEEGDSTNNAVGSFSATVTGWSEVGEGQLVSARSIQSKTFAHALIFPRLFDFLLLGNQISDCSMCHLKIRGDVGQINASDPMEMHIAFNSSRFNCFKVWGSIFTNGNFVRRAQAEGPDSTRNKQEQMLYAPGQINNYGTPENGQLPRMHIYAANGATLSTAWAGESGNPGENPFRAIESLVTPLPQTWPSVKKNLMGWFEPRATASIAAGGSEYKTELWDNNIGYVVPPAVSNEHALPWVPKTTIRNHTNYSNWTTNPFTFFQPFGGRVPLENLSDIIQVDPYNSNDPLRHYPMTVSTSVTVSPQRVLYGARDVRTQSISGTTVTQVSTTASDGLPDFDLDLDNVMDGDDLAQRAYLHAIDRAVNRSPTTDIYRNVYGESTKRLWINKGLHPVDDFDYDTVPNGFDPDLDGDGIPESPRASNDPDELGFHVTSQDCIDNGWVTWVDADGVDLGPLSVDPDRRVQWTLGYMQIQFAQSHNGPYTASGPTYWVRRGSLAFSTPVTSGWSQPSTSQPVPRAAWNSMIASAAWTGQANTANNVATLIATPPAGQYITNQVLTVWRPRTSNPRNGNPNLVWTAGGNNGSLMWPRLTGTSNNWSSTANTAIVAYRRSNQDVMTATNINRVYRIIDANPINLVSREFGWQAEVAGIASAGNGFSAMENLIMNQFASTPDSIPGIITGVFPSDAVDGDGNPVMAANAGERSLIMMGTQRNPLMVKGQLVVRGDVVITGWLSGKGNLITHRNVYLPSDLRYTNPPDWMDPADKSGDQFGIVSAGNILVGNPLHNTSGASDLMEFVWGNMIDINSASLTSATWNYGRDGSGSPSHNHMINPVYLMDGAEAGRWVDGEWQVENEGNCTDERFNSQGMRLGGGLVANGTNPNFNDNRRHTNWNGNSNPNTTLDNTSFFKNYWISTPGLLPTGASKIVAMPTSAFGVYTGAWFSPTDFKFFTLHPQTGTNAWTNWFGNENQNNWIKNIESVLYADFGVIGGNIASAGANYLEFKGAVIGRDIQLLSANQNNPADNCGLELENVIGTNLVGGLYYDHRLRGSINPLGFPFTELFIGGEMTQNYMPELVDGSRDAWIPFRLTAGYKTIAE